MRLVYPKRKIDTSSIKIRSHLVGLFLQHSEKFFHSVCCVFQQNSLIKIQESTWLKTVSLCLKPLSFSETCKKHQLEQTFEVIIRCMIFNSTDSFHCTDNLHKISYVNFPIWFHKQTGCQHVMVFIRNDIVAPIHALIRSPRTSQTENFLFAAVC